MAIGSKSNINELWKEYWLDVAGTSTAKSVNDAMRAGLEELGYSGSLNKMLKAWAVEQGGTSATINQAIKLTFADMVGETTESTTAMMPEYLKHISFSTILTKWEDEDRMWDYID